MDYKDARSCAPSESGMSPEEAVRRTRGHEGLNIPNGLIAVVCQDSARYHSFTGSLANLRRSTGSPIIPFTGANIAASCNLAVKAMNEYKLEWIWYMGDDHTFKPDILLKMLTKMYSQDIDILIPLCPFRKPPFGPVLFGPEDPQRPGYWKTIQWWDIDKTSGIYEPNVAGSAGMLVRKHVFDTMEKPYFRVGQERSDSMAEDLNFCKRARQHGFKILTDLDNWLGHTFHGTVYPYKNKDGQWGYQIDFGFGMRTAMIPVKDDAESVYDPVNDEYLVLTPPEPKLSEIEAK